MYAVTDKVNMQEMTKRMALECLNASVEAHCRGENDRAKQLRDQFRELYRNIQEWSDKK